MLTECCSCILYSISLEQNKGIVSVMLFDVHMACYKKNVAYANIIVFDKQCILVNAVFPFLNIILYITCEGVSPMKIVLNEATEKSILVPSPSSILFCS